MYYGPVYLISSQKTLVEENTGTQKNHQSKLSP